MQDKFKVDGQEGGNRGGLEADQTPKAIMKGLHAAVT
jgi:hypothetical protein